MRKTTLTLITHRPAAWLNNHLRDSLARTWARMAKRLGNKTGVCGGGTHKKPGYCRVAKAMEGSFHENRTQTQEQ